MSAILTESNLSLSSDVMLIGVSGVSSLQNQFGFSAILAKEIV